MSLDDDPVALTNAARARRAFAFVRRVVASAYARVRLPPGEDGRAPATALEIRVGRWIGAPACIWYALVAFWGAWAAPGAGHFGAGASTAMAADNMVRWHTFLPVLNFIEEPPVPGQLFLHHPFASFWATAIVIALTGRHDITVPLAPALCSCLTIVLVYKIGRAAWGPISGAIGALAYTALPMAMVYAPMNALEIPLLAATALGSWGYLRFVQTSRRRYLTFAIIGAFWAVNCDWQAVVWLGVLLGVTLFRGFLLPRTWFDPVDARRFGLFWALSASLAVLSVLGCLAACWQNGLFNNLLDSGRSRGLGGLGLMDAIKARQNWLNMTITPFAIALGALALPVIVVRLFIYRKDADILPIAAFLMAAFQYVAFSNGADVHVFWPLPFALYFGLAAASLAAVYVALGHWFGQLIPRARHLHIALPLLLLGAPLVWLFVSALPILRYGRLTGGSLTQGDGTGVDLRGEENYALRWFLRRLPQDSAVGLSEVFDLGPDVLWNIGRRPVTLNFNPHGVTQRAPFRMYALNARKTPAEELRAFAARAHVIQLGSLWMVDTTEHALPLDALAVEHREPNIFEWMVFGGQDVRRHARFDAWLTWEWRVAVHQQAAIPVDPPQTLDQTRIAYNAALLTKNVDAAARYESALLSNFEIKYDKHFDDGTVLVGGHFMRGSAPELTLLFRAGKGRGAFSAKLHSHVDEGARFSLVPKDLQDYELGNDFDMPSSLWTEGHLYTVRDELHVRPGRETFSMNLVSLDGSAPPAPVGFVQPLAIFSVD